SGTARSAVRRVVRVNVEAVSVDTDARYRPQPRRPGGFVLRIAGGAGLDDGVQPDRLEELTSLRVVQANGGDVVVPDLNAERVLHLAAQPMADTAMADFPSRDEPVIGLVELVAVDRIVQKICEVGKQIEIVPDAVRRDLRRRVVARALPLERTAVTIGVA